MPVSCASRPCDHQMGRLLSLAFLGCLFAIQQANSKASSSSKFIPDAHPRQKRFPELLLGAVLMAGGAAALPQFFDYNRRRYGRPFPIGARGQGFGQRATRYGRRQPRKRRWRNEAWQRPYEREWNRNRIYDREWNRNQYGGQMNNGRMGRRNRDQMAGREQKRWNHYNDTMGRGQFDGTTRRGQFDGTMGREQQPAGNWPPPSRQPGFDHGQQTVSGSPAQFEGTATNLMAAPQATGAAAAAAVPPSTASPYVAAASPAASSSSFVGSTFNTVSNAATSTAKFVGPHLVNAAVPAASAALGAMGGPVGTMAAGMAGKAVANQLNQRFFQQPAAAAATAPAAGQP